jgi:hypothetical protein
MSPIRRLILSIGAVAAVGSAAHATPAPFVYDTTAGTETVYTGDLTAGTLSLTSIDGRSFRVQRVGQSAALGEFGVGAPPASLNASMTLVNFDNQGTPIDPIGDTALFTGVGGMDFVVRDEFGGTWSGHIGEFLLTDRSDSFIPGIEGQGFIEDLVFSGPTFQGIDVTGLVDEGTIFSFAFTIPGISLKNYLETSGLGGLPIEVETVEARVDGFVPLPPTTGLALAGLIPFVVTGGRRR